MESLPSYEKGLSQFELDVRRREQERLQAERELNAKLDKNITSNIDKHPPALYYIIPNEFAERFCFYGVKNILLYYFVAFAGYSDEDGKAQTHLFAMLVYFFPIIGSAVSDSFLGKYHTIVFLSIVYFLGTALLSVFAINNVLGSIDAAGKILSAAPYWAIFIPLLLIAIGSGGIKPCVSAHGGDQYLPSQTILLTKFFSYFYVAINVGSVMSGLLVPFLKDVPCMGANSCYSLAFAVPSVVFGVALIIFIAGKKKYRIVPAAGGFLPWTAVKACTTSFFQWNMASKSERREKGGILNFGIASYGVVFMDEIRLLGKVIFMIMPYMFFWMIYDQGVTEWQLQYEHMDHRFGLVAIPAEVSGNINSIFIIILLPILAKFIYPFLEKRGLRTRPLARMMFGFFVVIIAFLIGAFVQDEVDRRFADATAAGGVIMNGKRVEKCDGCLHGMWQLPQWFLMTFGEVFTSPTGLEFVYSEVGPSFRATSSAIWLLMVSFGNLIVVSVTKSMEKAQWKRSHMDFLYCGIGTFALIIAFAQSRWMYTYKADRTDIDSSLVQAEVHDPEETENVHHSVAIPGDTERDEGYRGLLKEKEQVDMEEATVHD